MKVKVQKLSWDEAGEVLTIEYPKIGKKLVVDTRDHKPEQRSYAKTHGYGQRYGDLESGDKTGEAKFQAATKYHEHQKTSADWALQAERDTLSELILAVHKVMPQFSVEQLTEAAEAAPDQVEEWRDSNEVKLELAKQRVAKAQARVKAEGKKQPLTIKGLK